MRSLQSRWLRPAALTFCCFASPALAADYVINADTSAINGGFVLGAGDSLTLNSGVTASRLAPDGPFQVTQNTIALNLNGTTRGATDYAVSFNSLGGTLINTGLIETSGIADGIRANANGMTLNNSGSILTGGNGIVFTSAGSLTNTGTIIATGAGMHAIRSNGTSTSLNLSGFISAPNSGIAIGIYGAETGLTLNAGLFVEGSIILAGSNFVTINTGAAQSFSYTFEVNQWFSLTINGDIPVVVSGNVVSSVDPTAFAGAETQMTGLGDQLFETGRNAMGATAPSVTRSSKHQGSGTSAWFGTFGSLGQHGASGNNLAYQTSTAGLLGGWTLGENGEGVSAMMLGAGRSNFAADGLFAASYRIATTGLYLGVSGHEDRADGLLDFALNGGVQEHASVRTINNNNAPAGLATASATYKSLFLAPRVSLTRDVLNSGGWSLQARAGLGVTFGLVEGYSEAGAAAATSVSARRFGITSGGADLILSRQFGQTSVTGTLGVAGRANMFAETISGAIFGTGWTYANPGTGGWAGRVGININHAFSENIVASLSAGASVSTGGLSEQTGSASLKIGF